MLSIPEKAKLSTQFLNRHPKASIGNIWIPTAVSSVHCYLPAKEMFSRLKGAKPQQLILYAAMRLQNQVQS